MCPMGVLTSPQTIYWRQKCFLDKNNVKITLRLLWLLGVFAPTPSYA